jgi:hypothetical protein
MISGAGLRECELLGLLSGSSIPWAFPWSAVMTGDSARLADRLDDPCQAPVYGPDGRHRGRDDAGAETSSGSLSVSPGS